MDIMFDRLMLMELRENVSKIDSKSFAELRSYNEPPKIVQNIVKAVVAIFHLEQVESGELDDWTNLRNVSQSAWSVWSLTWTHTAEIFHTGLKRLAVQGKI